MSVVLIMKTYGDIDLEARLAHVAARDTGLISYEEALRITKESNEVGTQAVIEEFKRRNGIEDKSATG